VQYVSPPFTLDRSSFSLHSWQWVSYDPYISYVLPVQHFHGGHFNGDALDLLSSTKWIIIYIIYLDCVIITEGSLF